MDLYLGSSLHDNHKSNFYTLSNIFENLTSNIWQIKNKCINFFGRLKNYLIYAEAIKYEPQGPVSWSPDKHKKSVYAQQKSNLAHDGW